MPVPFEAAFLVSIVSGFIGALTGMGGGIILIPGLTLLGVDIKHAIAVSIVSVIATSSGAASAYVRDRITNLKVGMFLEVFTIVGALTGASLSIASGRAFLFTLFGLLLLGSGAALVLQHPEHATLAVGQDGVSRWLELQGSYYDEAARVTIRYEAVRGYVGGPAMFVAGMIAGLLGIGAGAVKVLVQELLMRLPTKVSTTTSNLIIGVTALAGSSVYLAAGLIDPGLATPVILGVSVGAFAGTRLLVRLTNATVRWFFLLVLLSLGVEMIVRGIREAL